MRKEAGRCERVSNERGNLSLRAGLPAMTILFPLRPQRQETVKSEELGVRMSLVPARDFMRRLGTREGSPHSLLSSGSSGPMSFAGGSVCCRVNAERLILKPCTSNLLFQRIKNFWPAPVLFSSILYGCHLNRSRLHRNSRAERPGYRRIQRRAYP